MPKDRLTKWLLKQKDITVVDDMFRASINGREYFENLKKENLKLQMEAKNAK